jgi:catechol-2,3-dioxygenase
MPKVMSVDHLSLKVSNFKKSKKFYDQVLTFLGFKKLDEYSKSKGYTNGNTRLWISQADKKEKKHKYHIGEIGFHHYAFRLGSRKEVDQLEKFLKKIKAKIVDPAGEYYDNYYGVYFNDPDGLKIEGMFYGK